MTISTFDPSTGPALPGEVVERLERLVEEDRERALRLMGVAQRCCGGDVSVLVAIVDAVTPA